MPLPPTPERRPCRLVVLISGSGTNLQALIQAIAADLLDAEIRLVISNRPQAGGLDRAAGAGIPTRVIDHREQPSREHFDEALMQAIDAVQPDAVVLAGFMRILTPAFVQRYTGRLLNIHPSLLPRHPGLHTHQRALDAGDAEHGASVHFVTDDLDGGPIILQAAVPVLPGDTPERLAARVLVQEHLIYPQALQWFCQGRLRLVDHRAELDGQPLAIATAPVNRL